MTDDIPKLEAMIAAIDAADRVSDPVAFATEHLWIRDKSGKIIRLDPNPVQVAHYRDKARAKREGKPARFLVLKARRMGITTWEQAESFHLVVNTSGQKAVTLAHEASATEQIFRIATLYYDQMDPEVRPAKTRAVKRELEFPALKSSFYIGTAGAKGFARGDTLQRVHGSEVAFWPGGVQDIENLVAGITEAASHGEVVFESTANGMGNWFHQTWVAAEKGQNDWTPLFYPWFSDPSYSIPLQPGEGFDYTEDELHLVEKHGLTPGQINWRRQRQKARGRLFTQEYPENPVSAFLTSGLLFFQADIVQSYAAHLHDPVPVAELRKIEGAPSRDVLAEAVVWHAPEAGKTYVIGADVSEGIEGADLSCAVVLDRDGRQCAALHGYWRPEVFAAKACALGRWYHNALLGVEAQNHGHSALNTARHTIRYPRLYTHRDYDQRHGERRKLGWQTTAKTRPLMLDDLAEAVHNGYMQINHREFLEECLVFADNGKGKYEARPGYHDDTIMAWAIAWQLRKSAPSPPRSMPLDEYLREQANKLKKGQA